MTELLMRQGEQCPWQALCGILVCAQSLSPTMSV